MIEPSGRRLTARDIFFDDPTAAPEAVRRALDDDDFRKGLSDNLPAVTATASRFVVSQAVEAVDRFLGELGIEEMLLGGWLQLAEVQSAIEATNTKGGSRHVALTRQHLTSSHHPTLEVVVADAPIRVADFSLDIGFDLDACELVVRDGAIRGIEAGSVLASGALATVTRTILSTKSQRLPIDALFRGEAETPAASDLTT